MVAEELKKKINQMRGCEMRTFFFPYVRGTRLGPGLPLRTSKTLNDDFSPVLNKYCIPLNLAKQELYAFNAQMKGEISDRKHMD